jgi:membrane protease YdiL (CAAX protease family)
MEIKADIKEPKVFFKKLLTVLKLVGISYGVIFLIILLYSIFQNIFPNYLQSMSIISRSYASKLNNPNLYLKFFTMVLYAPILEELVFRFGITFKKKYIFTMITAFMVFSISPIIQGNFIFVSLICLYILLQIFFFRYLKNKKYYIYLSIVTSALFFAALHFNNFNHAVMDSFISYAIMLLPLVVLGFFFGKIRVKLGLFYAILGHMIVNLIGFLASTL